MLLEELRKQPGKVQVIRLRLEREAGRWFAGSAGNQQTAILRTMVDALALAVLPAGSSHFAAGDEVVVHFYGNHCERVGAEPADSSFSATPEIPRRKASALR